MNPEKIDSQIKSKNTMSVQKSDVLLKFSTVKFQIRLSNCFNAITNNYHYQRLNHNNEQTTMDHGDGPRKVE